MRIWTLADLPTISNHNFHPDLVVVVVVAAPAVVVVLEVHVVLTSVGAVYPVEAENCSFEVSDL